MFPDVDSGAPQDQIRAIGDRHTGGNVAFAIAAFKMSAPVPFIVPVNASVLLHVADRSEDPPASRQRVR